MNATSIFLVLASTVLHAYWNFLIKRSGGGGLTWIGLSKVVEVVVFAPAFFYFAWPDLRAHADAWPLILVAAALSLANYAALSRAYETGDLSIVYPVARGGALLFLPVLGFIVFDERLSVVGWISIALIMAGIAVIGLRGFTTTATSDLMRHLRDPSVAFAMLAALATALYTVWDKRAIQTLSAFAYFYAYTVFIALAYVIFFAVRYSPPAIIAEWRAHRSAIAQVGIFNMLSYLLVLVALRAGTSSYVLAVRQLSIAIGVLLGWKLLGEDLAGPKRVGVTLLVAGCLLVALA